MGKSRGVQAYDRCWAVDCGVHVNKLKCPNLAFHKFPKQAERCKKWVQLSGNLGIAVSTLKRLNNYSLCSKHFAPDQYKMPGEVRSGLIPNALPSIFKSPSIPDDSMPESILDDIHVPKLPKVSTARFFTAVPANKPSSPRSCRSPPAMGRTPLASIENIQRDSGNGVTPATFRCGVSVDSQTPNATPAPSRPAPTCTSAEKRRQETDNVQNKRRRIDFGFAYDANVTSTPLNKPGSVLPPVFISPTWSSPVYPLNHSIASILATSSDNVNPTVPDPAIPVSSVDSDSSNILGVSSVKKCKRSSKALTKERRRTAEHNTIQRLYNLKKSEVTPALRMSHRKHLYALKKLKRAKEHLQNVKGSRDALLKAANSPLVSDLAKTLKSREAAVLFGAQFKNRGKSSRGHRWNIEEKSVGLSLWRGARKNYSLLRRMMNLPSPSTLYAFLSRLKFDVGENKKFFEHLAKVVKGFSPRDRACVLMWDEVAIKRSLAYLEHQDRVAGFVNYGDGQARRGIANKCLVFMVQSLARRWKQPVAYYFGEDEVPAPVLSKLIVSIISHLQDAGFDVRSTVCDQGGNNRSAVKSLQAKFQPARSSRVPFCEECKARKKTAGQSFSRADCRVCRVASLRPVVNPFIRVNNSTNIWHMWDAPHLIKNLRSAFLKYNVDLGDGRVAKWEHLRQLHKQDGLDGTFYHIALKLTDDHLNFDNKKRGNKMKVKLAVQVLSCRVATALKKIHDWSGGEAIPGSLPTSEFIFEADRLFDSFNGGCKEATAKLLRCNMSENSPHLEFWDEMDIKIRKWHFIGSDRVLPFHVGLLENITAYKGLWGDLSTAGDPELRFRYLNLRKINQDALENLFSAIKQGGRIPTVIQFIGGLKTAIITNLKDNGTGRGNCADDGGSLLTDLRLFMQSVWDEDEPETDRHQYETEETEYLGLTRLFLDSDEIDSSIGAAVPSDPIPATGGSGVETEVAVSTSEDASNSRWLTDVFECLYGGDDNYIDSDTDKVVAETDCDKEMDVDDEAADLDCNDSDELVFTDMDTAPVLASHPVSVPESSEPSQPTLEDDFHLTVQNVPELIQRTRKDRDPFNPKYRSEDDAEKDAELEGAMALRKEYSTIPVIRRKKVAYVSGFVIKKVLQFVECDACQLTVLTDKPNRDHDLVLAFERDHKQRLTYAHSNVIDIIISALDIFLVKVFVYIHRPALKETFTKEIMNAVDMSCLGCQEAGHAEKVHKYLLLYFFRVSVYHHLRLTNRKLDEKYKQNSQAINHVIDRCSRAREKGKSQQTSVQAEHAVDDPPAAPNDLLDEFVSPELLAFLDTVDS